uniref:Uncharacterized protein n=1 Tax=Panagrolaimus superbus TaxID=310955 RepID=A0A914YTG4_9BILA
MSSGHYTATMCGFDGKSVYNFDDDITRQVAFPNKPIQPYILFYSCNLPSRNLSSSSKSPLPTPAKKPNLNASISQKNPSFTVKKDNDNGIAKRVPANYFSMLNRN